MGMSKHNLTFILRLKIETNGAELFLYDFQDYIYNFYSHEM
jgi:hypothetical protein